jgi:outer membrane protein OmpA-like peptidoglycan-associated protein
MAAVNKAGVGTYSSPIEVVYEVTGTSGGGTTYTCPSGGTLNGTNCVTTTTSPAIAEPTYSCPAGKQLTGADCFVVTQYTATATPIYKEQCPSGWTGDASAECFRFTTTTQLSCTNNGGTWVGGSSQNCEFFTPEVKVQTGTTYSCNGADVLSGTTCTNIVATPATQGPPYTYGCVGTAVLSGQTCTLTTTAPATKGTTPVVNVYGYVEMSSSVTTTTTTPGTTTTTLPSTGLHLTAVVVPFALNSARLSAATNRAIIALARSVNRLPKGDTVVSVTVRGYADPIKSGAFNHALALSRARVVSSAFANRLNPNSAYLYKLNVLAGGTKFAASAKEHGTASHRRAVITVDYTK